MKKMHIILLIMMSGWINREQQAQIREEEKTTIPTLDTDSKTGSTTRKQLTSITKRTTNLSPGMMISYIS